MLARSISLNWDDVKQDQISLIELIEEAHGNLRDPQDKIAKAWQAGIEENARIEMRRGENPTGVHADDEELEEADAGDENLSDADAESGTNDEQDNEMLKVPKLDELLARLERELGADEKGLEPAYTKIGLVLGFIGLIVAGAFFVLMILMVANDFHFR